MRLINTNWPARRNTSADLFDEMERMFDDFQRSLSPAATPERNFTPACDVSEEADRYVMTVDLPGFKKEDIKIEVNDNVLTIAGERRREASTDDKKNHRFERSYGSFVRSFSLPTSVSSEKVEAHYEDGVLNLSLPKTPVAKSRTIEIQSKNGGSDKLPPSSSH